MSDERIEEMAQALMKAALAMARQGPIGLGASCGHRLAIPGTGNEIVVIVNAATPQFSGTVPIASWPEIGL